jgi:hypothetical protein
MTSSNSTSVIVCTTLQLEQLRVECEAFAKECGTCIGQLLAYTSIAQQLADKAAAQAAKSSQSRLIGIPLVRLRQKPWWHNSFLMPRRWTRQGVILAGSVVTVVVVYLVMMAGELP